VPLSMVYNLSLHFPCTNLLSVGIILVAGQIIKDYEHYISVVGTVSNIWAVHQSNCGLTPGSCRIFSVLQHIHLGSRAHPASYKTDTVCSISVSTQTACFLSIVKINNG
jgi:hypothetical protein